MFFLSFLVGSGGGGGCGVSHFSKRIIDSFINRVLWIYKLSLKGASRSLVILLFFLEHLVVVVCCCTIVFPILKKNGLVDFHYFC